MLKNYFLKFLGQNRSERNLSKSSDYNTFIDS